MLLQSFHRTIDRKLIGCTSSTPQCFIIFFRTAFLATHETRTTTCGRPGVCLHYRNSLDVAMISSRSTPANKRPTSRRQRLPSRATPGHSLCGRHFCSRPPQGCDAWPQPQCRCTQCFNHRRQRCLPIEVLLVCDRHLDHVHTANSLDYHACGDLSQNCCIFWLLNANFLFDIRVLGRLIRLQRV